MSETNDDQSEPRRIPLDAPAQIVDLRMAVNRLAGMAESRSGNTCPFRA